LGLANGVLSMGMALGFITGSMISATVLSPWLGGWRNVLLFYGVIAMIISLPWFLIRPAPTAAALPAGETGPRSMRRTLAYVARIRKMWLLGWAILGIGGCIQGTLGYLPLYLQGLGWPEPSADGALAAFHTVSMICVVPIALGSDRLGSRKKVLVAAALMIALGVGLLSIAEGAVVWMAVCLAGMVRDGFMAVFLTMIIETEGIGAAYAGTASGLVMVFSGLGNLLAPPLGNSLAATVPGLPFLFWSALAVMGLGGLYAAKERDAASILAAQPSEQAG
jgi:MFS family permease